MLLSEEVRFSENIDFQYPMKQACLEEIELFCKDVPHGNARVIRQGWGGQFAGSRNSGHTAFTDGSSEAGGRGMACFEHQLPWDAPWGRGRVMCMLASSSQQPATRGMRHRRLLPTP